MKTMDDYATEINRLRNVIQAACTGGTGYMIERWKVLFPDEPVPSVKPTAPTPLADSYIDDCDTGALHVMAPRGRDSVREFARRIERAHGIV